MKRRSLLLSAIILPFCVLLGSVLWLMYTAAGTSFLSKNIVRILPGTVEIGKISGIIGRAFRIEGFRINTSEMNITVSAADLKWQPFLLLTGRLSITSLGIHDVVVTNKKPPENTPYDLLLPKVPLWLTFVQGKSDNTSIGNLKYLAPGREPVTVNNMSAKILWYEGALYVNKMKAETSYGAAKGHLMVGLARPALHAQIEIALAMALAGVTNISIDANLPVSKGEEQIAGTVVLKTAAGARERFNMECRVAITRHTVRINNGKLTGKGIKGSIEARGELDVSGTEPVFTLSAKINRLNVAPEPTVSTDISGDLHIMGTLEEYHGGFNLKNTGPEWKKIELRGGIHGNTDRIELANLDGKLLGGTLLGELKASWISDVTLSAHLTGKNLDPAKIRPGLQGNLNVECRSRLQITGNLPMEASFTANVFNSHFQKKRISGKLDAALHNKILHINSLSAKGNGFNVNAFGVLQQRVSYLIQIDDASKLFPETRGSVSAEGWARWRDSEPAGIINVEGKNIAYSNNKVSSFHGTIQIPDGYNGKVAVDIRGQNISYGPVQTDLADLRINGQTGGHKIDLIIKDNDDRIDLLAEGKYAEGAWLGTILKLSGKDTLFGRYELEEPSTVNISNKQVRVSPFALISTGGERIDVNTDIIWNPVAGFVDIHWQNVNLARANRFVGASKFEGRTSGVLRGKWSDNQDLDLSGRISGSGTFSQGAMRLKMTDVNSKITWDKSGLLASCNVNLAEGGRLNATITSKESAVLGLPEQGTFQTVWRSIDLDILRPVFPDTLQIKGKITGKMKGNLLPGNRLDLTGETSLSGGTLSWHNNDGDVTAVMKEADLRWTWKDAYLKGEINLALAQHGLLEASFRLPIPANIRSEIDRNGPITVSAKGELHEKGMLSALFPGFVQETAGHISFQVTGGGTFSNPQLDGQLNLSGAGAYLPSAGIRFKDARAQVLFNREQVNITSFYVRSGPGYVEGNAVVHLRNLHLERFEGTLRGERFQTVSLPELQALISPGLTYSGTAKTVSVKGSILLQEALLSQEQKDTLIKPSPDVVVKGREAKSKETLSFPLNVTIAVVLGDRVLVKAYGVETALTGTINVIMKDVNDIRARGVISTVNGKYDAYGVKLNVSRGQVVFSGDSLDRATLDILAIRQVDDVTAGVKVTGAISSPLVDLYSKPSMPDMDVLSYIVLGRPGYNGQNDMALLSRAAGALLTSGKSSGLQDRLKNRLGLDTIDIESGNGDLSQSIIKIGKYLSPKLYISYGRSIFTGENLFGLRYNLSKRMDLESTMGSESSAVLYYKVEFD